MANETTVQTSSIGDQDTPEADENIPPSSFLSNPSKLTSETCPTTPNKNVKGKPRLSGLQSALTPILKYLHIGSKSSVSLFSCNNGTAKPNESVLSTMSHSTAFGDRDSVACSVLNENLPEITLLDVTCDSTMNMTRNSQCDSAPSTPVFVKPLKRPEQNLDINLNSKGCPNPNLTPFRWICDEVLPEMSIMDDTWNTTVDLAPKCETEVTPKQVEIDKLSSTLTPKTDSSSIVSQKETHFLETTHDRTPKKRPSSETSAVFEKTAKLDCPEDKKSTTFTGNLTHSLNSGSEVSESNVVEDVKKVQLQETQDISMSSALDSSKTSSENSGHMDKIMDKTQPPADSHPVNVTRDLSSSNMSVQSDCSRSLDSKNATSELQAEPNVTSEVQAEPNVTSDLQSKPNLTVELKVEPVKASSPEKIPNQTFEMTTKETSENKAGSLNNTFTLVQSSELSSASTQESNPQNRTLDLPTSDNSKPEITETPQTSTSSKSSPETSPVSNDNCSDSKSSQSCEIQNQTFERNSLQKSSGSTIISQAGTTITSETFENKPNETKDDTAAGEKQQEKETAPSPVKNAVTNEPPLPEISSEKIQATTDTNAKPAEPCENTFEVNPAVEDNSGASASSGEAKDSLNSGNGHESIHQNTFNESHKANTFNMDNTLDFKSDSLITSTPMPTSKAFNFTIERDGNKMAAAQKKLYREGPSKPVQATSELPSNIVGDRKTFLPLPSTKNHLPTMKPPSLLSKFKPASIFPKHPELLTSGLPMTRQVEALKSNAPQLVLQQTTDITSSYNLRPSTVAASSLKPPTSGIRKPASSSIPSGIHRPGHGLKPPAARTTASGSSGSDKPAAGTNPLLKTTQPKKHPLAKVEVLPAAKKKKIDPSVPSSNPSVSSSDAAAKAKPLKPPTHSQRTLPSKAQKQDTAVLSTSSETSEPTSRVRSLKPPATGLKAPTSKPLCQGCTNCSSLEEQLKLKDEEIRRLKEELLKCNKKEDSTPL